MCGTGVGFHAVLDGLVLAHDLMGFLTLPGDDRAGERQDGFSRMSTRRGWIEVSQGSCGFCAQRHALEIEYRCVQCDREVCALCVVVLRERRETWCPACVSEAD